jgi:glyoxylase-like metal-dependent hydrolase (beta-lactamase superfamily II)
MSTPNDLQLFALSYGSSVFAAKYIFEGDTSGRDLDFDWLFYCLRFDDRVILMDTGFRDPAPAAQYGVTIWSVPDLLLSIGIKPEDVTDIVVTHADFDHADNVDLFPNANIVIQQQELQRILTKADADASPDLAQYLAGNTRVRTFTDATVLYDFLHVEKVGGHTIGSSVLWFTKGDTTYLLPGDECYVADNARKGLPIGYYRDLATNKQYVESVSRMKNTVVLPFHDPGVLQQYKAVAPHVAQVL